ILRRRIESCRNVAIATPASVANPNDPGAYKPATEFDNTPWRYAMNQNGRRMPADEFDAWMKAPGVRVARGGAPAAPAAPAAAPGGPAPAATGAEPAPEATPADEGGEQRGAAEPRRPRCMSPAVVLPAAAPPCLRPSARPAP